MSKPYGTFTMRSSCGWKVKETDQDRKDGLWETGHSYKLGIRPADPALMVRFCTKDEEHQDDHEYIGPWHSDKVDSRLLSSVE